MAADKKEKAKNALQQLFESLSIKRIVCVDDEYSQTHPPEEAIGLIDVVGPRVAGPIINNKSLPINQDRDIWVPAFNDWWAGLSENQRRQILYKLQGAAHEASGKSREDLRSASSLAELFAGLDFLELSFSQWKVQKNDLLLQSRDARTLFLFDEDLSKDGGTDKEGRALIRDVLGSNDARTAMFALLSHNFAPGDEFIVSQRFTEPDYQFDPSRVVAVSKGNLGSSPLDFARAIKLTVLNPDRHELAKLSVEMMKSAHQEASRKLEELSIYTFDHMVFKASNREGIWEPDTLFRLLNLFQRKEARSAALQSIELRRLAEKIRSVSNIPTELDEKERPDDAWKIQQLELYEIADFINGSLLPIELGDVFERIVKNDEERRHYILLAQPCDLMVRPQEGARKGHINEVILARVSYLRTSDRENEYFTLPHYFSSVDKDKTAYVLFTDTHLVSLDTLDLCALNRKGVARIGLSDKPDHLVEAWQKRHAALLRRYRELIDNRQRITKALERFNDGKKTNHKIKKTILNTLNPAYSRSPLFLATVDVRKKAVSFNCKRVARFEPSHAAAMWTKYCNFMARAAFDVDLGE